MSILLTSTRRPVSWPDWLRAKSWIFFIFVFLLLFVPIYVAGALLAARHDKSIYLGSDFEVAIIPFIPWTIVIYFSLYSAFCVPLFQLSSEEITRLTRQSFLALGITAVIFFVVPTQSSYPVLPAPEPWTQLFDMLRAIDTRHNAAPSLHVAFAVIVLGAAAQVATRPARLVYLAWCFGLSLSTLTTHQHHLIDVLAGALLGLAVRRLSPLCVVPAATR